MSKTILHNLKEAEKLLAQFIQDANSLDKIEKAAQLMAAAVSNNRKIVSCGNGGSMCDAMHFAEELSGRFREDRKALAAISISDPSHLSCVGNDYGFDYVFSRYLEGVGQAGYVLLAISTSGNSKNVVNAIHVAKQKGITVVALTGKDGGVMKGIADIEIRAPFSTYADRAQEIHIKIIHSLIHRIEELTASE